MVNQFTTRLIATHGGHWTRLHDRLLPRRRERITRRIASSDDNLSFSPGVSARFRKGFSILCQHSFPQSD